MLSDRIKLNDDETEFIVIGTRQQLAKVNIESMRVGDSTTTPASEVKNLKHVKALLNFWPRPPARIKLQKNFEKLSFEALN